VQRKVAAIVGNGLAVRAAKDADRHQSPSCSSSPTIQSRAASSPA
jgi:hypothetical protein